VRCERAYAKLAGLPLPGATFYIARPIIPPFMRVGGPRPVSQLAREHLTDVERLPWLAHFKTTDFVEFYVEREPGGALIVHARYEDGAHMPCLRAWPYLCS
jgi:hypothetical protein